MLILGIECTGQRSSVALLRADEVLASEPLRSEFGPPTKQLIPTIQAVCRREGIELREIGLLAVTKGPGSFTGLRVGLTLAKTFAYASGCDLKGVPNFEATLFGQPRDLGRIEVVEDLRKGQVAWQRFSATEHGWQADTEIVAEPWEAWREREHDQQYHAGLGLKRLGRLFPNGDYPESWRFLPEEEWCPDAVDVARCGYHLLQEDGSDDPYELVPLYVRRSAAEERARSQSF